MKAIRVHEPGGPEAMTLDEIELSDPGPGEALVRVEAAGVNFIDVYHRTGLYERPAPIPLGLEGAGVIEATGGGVELAPGTRVAWNGVAGSYATHVVAPADKLVELPGELDPQTGAASMLQGLTAHYLTRSTYPLRAGESCLIHAAAGGVGLLLCQMARRAGARVFGTTSTEEKARAARAAGADEVILYTRTDFAGEIAQLTGGAGVHVVYDSVGRSTFEGSLRCLRPRGMLVSFGQSSGRVEPFDLLSLSRRGSLFLTRPSLVHYTATPEELRWRAGEVLSWIAGGELRVRVDRALPLAEAAESHRLLEGRRTSGKLLLIP